MDLGAGGAEGKSVKPPGQHKYADVADAWELRVIAAETQFTAKDTLEVDGKPLLALACVISKGFGPTVSGIAGVQDVKYLTSTTATELTEVAQSPPGGPKPRAERVVNRTAHDLSLTLDNIDRGQHSGVGGEAPVRGTAAADGP